MRLPKPVELIKNKLADIPYLGNTAKLTKINMRKKIGYRKLHNMIKNLRKY